MDVGGRHWRSCPYRRARGRAHQLASELGECRQRGRDRLDVDTAPQSPIRAEQLERLALGYCARAAPELHGRIACIKRLLRDALAEYGKRGNQADVELITILFFGDPTTSGSMSAGEMLKLAMNKRGVSDDKKFRDDRRRALGKFAEFLIVFAHEGASIRRRHTALTGAIAFVALVVATGAVIWVGTRPAAPTLPGPGLSSSPVQTTVSSPPFVQGRTYTETVNTPLGARTYTNPHNLIGEGQRIDNRKNVQVSCKIVAPSVPTVGLYWYRVASPPWNDQYYAPANSFLNGDPITGPYRHVVDAAVPYCLE